LRGDYVLRPVPAESKLAVEVGVSRMTARKAVLRLVDQGLLVRADNGRLVVRSQLRSDSPPAVVAGQSTAQRPHSTSAIASISTTQIAFAVPAHGSPEFDRWRLAADRAAAIRGLRLRMVHYHHWDDPILTEAIETFDGLFLLPPAEPVPPNVVKTLRDGRAKVVALDADLTPHGIRSIDLIPPSSIQRLLDHLAEFGHRRIHCFNSQPIDSVIEQRIEQWSLWCAAQDAEGELLNEADTSYGDPVKKAYESMSVRLSRGPLNASGIICMTMPAALGVMRALYERGIQVGRAVSVCAANDEGMAAYLCPSLTATRMPDPQPYLSICLQWMAAGTQMGPLLSRPTDVPLFIGESTGPALATL
jgi:DNA-binding LacI/PurR family transcriptional regulator